MKCSCYILRDSGKYKLANLEVSVLCPLVETAASLDYLPPVHWPMASLEVGS